MPRGFRELVHRSLAAATCLSPNTCSGCSPLEPASCREKPEYRETVRGRVMPRYPIPDRSVEVLTSLPGSRFIADGIGEGESLVR